MADLGSRLRARRKELKLTLRDLAARCGLSASFLCDLERGKRSLGGDSLMALSDVLGLPMDQLMRGGEPQTSGPAVQLPASLMTYASQVDLSFRAVTCLYWMARTLMDHRQVHARVGLDAFDWARFHRAVEPFL